MAVEAEADRMLAPRLLGLVGYLAAALVHQP
jgi:hypothetical protein